MKRVILIGSALVVVLLVAVFWYVYSSLDSLVEQAIEHYGSEAAGTRVEVGSVSISLSDGRGTLRDVSVANPEGFSSAHALYFREVTLQIDLGSIGENPVVLEEIFIDAPQVRYERNDQGTSNIDVIRQNLQSSGGGGASQQEGEETRLTIRKFEARNGRIEADAPQLDEEIRADLPTVRLSGLGGNSGAPPSEIGKEVLAAFGKSTATAVARQGILQAIDKNVGGEAGKALKKILGK